MSSGPIGMPASRVDGRAKVTGDAKYAGEYAAANLVYGVVVSSAVARGRITRIEATEALGVPGVLHVLTHENVPDLARSDRSYRDQIAPAGSPFRPLHVADVIFSAQPVALVVAETFELARYAASLVRVEYEIEAHATNLDERLGDAREPAERPGIKPPPKPRGDARKAFGAAAVTHEAEYRVPVEHHNPMEPFATTAVRHEDGTITVYDKTQGVQNVRDYLVNVFGCARGELRVVSRFVGGAFGAGLRPQYQVFLAVLAARVLKRSVRVTLTRQQMFSLGYRPANHQRIAIGADGDGTLEAVIHESVAVTSRYEDYTDEVVNWSGLLYRCDNVTLTHQVVPLDLCTPHDMRAPGAAWGLFALESAMDELAVRLGVDPIELRLRNYAERDQNEGKPFSSKELRECYRQGAERFGWARRSPEPRSMRDGQALVGWGMAGGVWEAIYLKASARAVLTPDGRLAVSSATADIGTGTYTIMTQVAAESLGLALDRVTFTLGDSSLPDAPVEGGSFTAASVGSAVKAACDKVRDRLLELARKVEGSPIADVALADLTFSSGRIHTRSDPARGVSLADAMHRSGVAAIEEKASAGPSRKQLKFGRYAHSAVFAEVQVDPDLGTIRVTRVVSAVAAGRVLNPKTARSQVLGGVVWGIGMALEEESVLDHAFGRFMNHNLAEYHVAVNADVHDIDVIFVDERDDVVNPLGAKGLGELGLVGVAVAVANAVYHATGKRIRELPITPDKLL